MNNTTIHYGIDGKIFRDQYNLYGNVKAIKEQYRDTPVIITITYINENNTFVMSKEIDLHAVESYDNFKWIIDEAIHLMKDNDATKGRLIYRKKEVE